MKKKIVWLALLACLAVPFAACKDNGASSSDNSSTSAEGHSYEKHAAVAPTCETAGNDEYYTCGDCEKIFDASKNEIAAIPTKEALGHGYQLEQGKDATCSTKGEIDHYSCDSCDKVFDLTKQEIDSIETNFDNTNHAATASLVATTNATKLTYNVGDTFDPTGMVVSYKCDECEGEVVDNQYLTYAYQGEGATAFALGDTKVTVQYNGMSFDVAITVGKAVTKIFDMEEAYATTCGKAPKMLLSSNVPESVIEIKYYDGETEVSAADFVAGKTYKAKAIIAETDTALGAEATADIIVLHGYNWRNDATDWKKMNYACTCGDTKDFYVMDYQSPYVDADHLEIDLSKFVVGAQNVSVKSVQQIKRVKDGAFVSALDGDYVDIDYTNEGMVYSFAANSDEHRRTFLKKILS